MAAWINYHHLFYFKTIAEEGSVSKAATILRVGQPTLSAQLKSFEEALGVQLFERRHKRLILTEHGRVALDYARSIFRMGSEMYEVIHDLAKPEKPRLCVGALDAIPKQIVLQIVKSALAVSPCQVTLVEGKSGEMIRELQASRMDLLVTNFIPQGEEGRGLVHRQIVNSEIGLFGAPRFAKLRKNFPRSVVGYPFLLPTYDSRLRDDIEHWAELNKIPLDVVTEGQDIALKKLLATEGLGLLPAALHSVTRQVLQGELVEIGRLSGISERLVLVAAKRKIANPLAARLMANFKI